MTTGKEAAALALGHELKLEGRSRLSLTGVTEVESFDEDAAVLETNQGTLIVRGTDLHMEQLDLERGQVRLVGTVSSMGYEENVKTTGSFWERLFR